MIKVDPKDIDCNVPWLFWSKELDKIFLESVATWGVLQPVVVSVQGDRYILVSGLKRVQACKELNKEVPVHIVSADNEIDRARIYITLNLTGIKSILDIVICARFFQSRLSEQEFSRFLSKEMAECMSRRCLSGLLDWLSLSPYWDKLLSAGHIHFEFASYLARLTEQDLGIMYPLFDKLSWSKNKAKNLITWLFEISLREDCLLSDLIRDMKLLEILEQDLSPKDCQQRILNKVRCLRYPCLTQLETEFSGLQNDLMPLKYWRLFPEQHFETNGLYLQSLIRDRSDTEQALGELQDLVRRERLQPFWDWQDKRFS